jgi:hypothetical protein
MADRSQLIPAKASIVPKGVLVQPAGEIQILFNYEAPLNLSFPNVPFC